MNKILRLDKKTEESFVRFILDRLGIVLQQHQLNDLHVAVALACERFNFQPDQYLEMLASCSDHAPMLEHLVAGITVGETYFYRDKRQMDFLQKTLLPTLINKKREENNLSLRIWSAGCSSGEEIYTIAMMLFEILTDLKKWKLHLLGTDINEKYLQKGMAGIYSEWSMRAIQEHYKNQFFIKKDRQYQLDHKIREMVTLDYLNLKSDTYPSIFNGTNAQDVILCRNVLIYFDKNVIVHLMHKLEESLAPGGYLILGASDPIHLSGSHLHYQHEKGMVFTKPQSLPTQLPHLPSQQVKQINLKASAKTIPAMSSKPKIDSKQMEIKLKELLNEARWEEVLDILQGYTTVQINQSVFLLNAKASALANMGQLKEAIRVLQSSLALDSTNKISYFLYALTQIELNQFQSAEAALRKTIFLDRAFVVGHYQLGLLLLRNKQQAAGIKYLINALTIASTKNKEQYVEGTNGITFGRLSEILKYEIEMYNQQGNASYARKDSTQKA